jgi:hypothetical protein
MGKDAFRRENHIRKNDNLSLLKATSMIFGKYLYFQRSDGFVFAEGPLAPL